MGHQKASIVLAEGHWTRISFGRPGGRNIKLAAGGVILRRLPLIIMFFGLAVILLGGYVGLAGGRLSPKLQRQLDSTLASRNGTQLSTNVSLCPGERSQ